MNTTSRGTFPGSTDGADIHIEAVPDAARRQALAFLLAGKNNAPVGAGVQPMPRVDADAKHRGNVELEPAFQSAGRHDDFLFWARSGERVAGVTWAHATSRMTVTIVPPRLDRGAPADVGQRLLASLLGNVAKRSGGAARCAVALIDDEEPGNATVVGAQTQWLSGEGFEQVATVEFLLATGLVSEPAWPFAIRPVGRGEAERFALALRMTTADEADASVWVRWRESAGLDLHEDDVETGGAGECYFVQHATCVVGVLVLAAARPEDEAREIRYLGILPAERRRGYAVETLRAVQQLAARQGQFVNASVDSAQTAAVRAYHRAGFQTWRRRQLWAKRIDAA